MQSPTSTGGQSDFLERHAGGRTLKMAGSRVHPWEERLYSYRKKRIEVEWVNYRHYLVGGSEKTTYMAYGNEASIGVAYWKIGMFVRVGPPGKRDIPVPEDVDPNAETM